MKTDLVEIFQTLRAGLQPYAAQGYAVHENSETGYDLYSEKNIETDGEKITERFFAGIYINGKAVEIQLNTAGQEIDNPDLMNYNGEKSGLKINSLDGDNLKEIETLVEIIHSNFKEKQWI